MRMRTLPEIVREIKEKDPGTALTYCSLRCKVLTGEIPCVQAGRKRLIDLDRLEEYLTPSATPFNVVPIETGAIRKVEI